MEVVPRSASWSPRDMLRHHGRMDTTGQRSPKRCRKMGKNGKFFSGVHTPERGTQKAQKGGAYPRRKGISADGQARELALSDLIVAKYLAPDQTHVKLEKRIWSCRHRNIRRMVRRATADAALTCRPRRTATPALCRTAFLPILLVTHRFAKAPRRSSPRAKASCAYSVSSSQYSRPVPARGAKFRGSARSQNPVPRKMIKRVFWLFQSGKKSACCEIEKDYFCSWPCHQSKDGKWRTHRYLTGPRE